MVFIVLLGRVAALDPGSSKTLPDPFMCENRAGSPLLGSGLPTSYTDIIYLENSLMISQRRAEAGVTCSL